MGDDSESSSYRFKIMSNDGDRIVSPYDGIIRNISQDGNLSSVKIEHNYNDKTLVSKIENIDRPVAISGSVRKGETLGYVKGEPVYFSVKTKSGDKVKINDLLFPQSDDIEKKKNKVKEPVIAKPKNLEYEQLPAIAKLFGTIAKVPGSLVKKGIKKLTQESNEEVRKNNELNEQFDRIKDLIKKINK